MKLKFQILSCPEVIAALRSPKMKECMEQIELACGALQKALVLQKRIVTIPESNTASVSPEAVDKQLRKMLDSNAFNKSTQVSQFLDFCVKETIAGRGANIKEYTIGIQAFKKPESFDVRMDSIVRVIARRVRQAIELYYRIEGQDDLVLIEMRSGCYVPTFKRAPLVGLTEADESFIPTNGPTTLVITPRTAPIEAVS